MKIRSMVVLSRLDDKLIDNQLFELHTHESGVYEFLFFLEGDGTLIRGRESIPAQNGFLVCIPPGVEHVLQPRTDGPMMSVYSLVVDCTGDGELCPLLREHLPSLQKNIHLGANRRFLFDELINLHSRQDQFAAKAAEFQVQSLVYEIIGKSSSSPEVPEVRSRHEVSIHVERALSLIQNLVYKRTSLEEISEQLNVSPEYLIRIFKKQMGMSPMRYLTHLKMEAAAALLTTGDLLVKEISWKLGFMSQYHFSRAFKMYSGATPVEYRGMYLAQREGVFSSVPMERESVCV